MGDRVFIGGMRVSEARKVRPGSVKRPCENCGTEAWFSANAGRFLPEHERATMGYMCLRCADPAELSPPTDAQLEIMAAEGTDLRGLSKERIVEKIRERLLAMKARS